MSCSDVILSEQTYDFILRKEEREELLLAPECIQEIDEEYSVLYYNSSSLPPISLKEYNYASIPKCFFLMDSTALEVSGIIGMQNQPGLLLKGRGIIVGIVDTGIVYENPLFLDANGESRILAIWDQSADLEAGNPNGGFSPPEGFFYGREYTKEDINRALLNDDPKSIVPATDTNGHGTFLASVVAGSALDREDFTGAVPLCDIAVVKLKEAKNYLREYFFFPKEEALYQENDIMAGVAYLNALAKREGKPLVILLGVGSNQGSHVGTDNLSLYLNSVGSLTGRCVVVPTGNEALAQHHFYGEADNALMPIRAEINVEAGGLEEIGGFCMELWSFAPELVRVVVQSPTGQQSQGYFPVSADTQTTRFVFENTVLTLDYRISGRRRGDLLIFMRFIKPAEGIWTVLVYPQITITGAFHMWLPIAVAGQGIRRPSITFLTPEPDTTLTTPSAAQTVLSAGGYNLQTDGIYLESGRGFDAVGGIKPELIAPAEGVSGSGLRGNIERRSGTSVGAAITAGAAAQALEWGILKGNAPTMNSVEVKNLLIRGAKREGLRPYPNTEAGYGKLDIYTAFLQIRP